MKKRQDFAALLKNKLTVSLLSDTKLRALLYDFFSKSPDKNFEETLLVLLQNKKIASVFPSFFISLKDFSTKSTYYILPLRRQISLFLCLFISQKEKLQKFLEFRNGLEHSILIADYVQAKTILDDAERDLGESIWMSRTRMLVLSGMGDTIEFQRYCKYCEIQTDGSFNTFILKCCQVIADTENAAIQLSSLVGRNVNELNEAKSEHLASLLEVLFYPHPLQPVSKPTNCMMYLQAFPVIDQYLIITSILRNEITRENDRSEEYEKLVYFAKSLSIIIKDGQTKNLACIDEVIKEGPVPFEGAALELYSLYNAGNYLQVIKDFDSYGSGYENSLTLINLAARAMAYEEIESTLDSRSPPVFSVANSLATIYRISPLWSQAEEQLISLAIKYNHLAHGVHIQVGLLKALPFMYGELSRINSARIAISLADNCTPQTYALACPKSIFQNGIDIGENIPDYRKIKHEIIKEMSLDSINKSTVDINLNKLVLSKALRKDILECHSLYYSITSQANKLFRNAAKNLIVDSNSFLCYPMEDLLGRVGAERLHDLHSIIISYHYVKSVSDEKDFVLHRAISSYLKMRGKTRPSEILQDTMVLTAEEKVFFRDICIPDILDYLDCFSNSNELRAERIKILDQLEMRGVVDPKTRMREVEEIVRQVIVDAGTSELNGAKIFVNDLAINKKHIDEISSLISLYQKIPEGQNERYTEVDTDTAKGAYISGTRNSVVERICNTIYSSFVYDDKYGLDRNLSAEIRHGFFSNLMRARLEEWHLLTEIDDKGRYLPNHYWREKNSLVHDSFWITIDDLLKDFSKSFDGAVVKAEEWMKVNSEPDEKLRVFSYVITPDEFLDLKDILNLGQEAEFVISYILEVLWRKTDSFLITMRERLNGEFKNIIDGIFDSAIREITNAKQGLPLVDLMQAFTRARNDINEDINTASEWFNRNENSGIMAGTLDRLIEIAVRSFEKVRGNAYTINIETPSGVSEVIINKQSARPFILAIINLLDNCYAHSGLGQSTRVEIIGKFEHGLATVTIINSLSREKQIYLDSIVIETIRVKLASSDVSKHIRGEGGTGLIKARNEIIYLGQKSELEISRDNEHFLARITYDYGELG